MNYTRAWAMPSGDTFSIKPIKKFLDYWLLDARAKGDIIDPFARNSKMGTITNDLNPKVTAQYHLDAIDFCEMIKENKINNVLNLPIKAVLFDPPYSPRQTKELYDSIGKKPTMKDTQTRSLHAQVKDILGEILDEDGIALSFGWNSCGFGKNRGFDIEEILLVSHGGGHNDTICVAERKL